MPRSAVGNLIDSDDIGRTGLFIETSSYPDGGDVDPAPLLPALQRAFGELHALGAFEQRELVGRVFADVADEHRPLFLEAVVVDGVIRQLLPVGVEIVLAL